jgi:hypothetical protein
MNFAARSLRLSTVESSEPKYSIVRLVRRGKDGIGRAWCWRRALGDRAKVRVREAARSRQRRMEVRNASWW